LRRDSVIGDSQAVLIQRRKYDAVNLIWVTPGVVQRWKSDHTSPMTFIPAYRRRDRQSFYDLKNLAAAGSLCTHLHIPC